MDDMLRYAWGQYRVWEATSRTAKAQVSRWTRALLLLTLAGTALGTMGPFLALPAPLGVTGAGIAAVLLAAATYVAAQLLGDATLGSWVQARALAETLKSECYKYVTHTPPYDSAQAQASLAQTTNELIQSGPGMLAPSLRDDERLSGAPESSWTMDEYVKRRIEDQITRYYRPAIERHAGAVRKARVVALMFGMVAVILSASTAPAGSESRAWVGALLGTLTTAAAAIAAWFQSGNHLQNALNYQNTVNKLELLLARHRGAGLDWRLVADAEAIFQAEHSAWLTQWQSSMSADVTALPKGAQQP